eukprot:PhM_4_TR17488/c0_g1_i1/m.96769
MSASPYFSRSSENGPSPPQQRTQSAVEWAEVHPGCGVWTAAIETCDTVLVSAKNVTMSYAARIRVSFAGSTNIIVRCAATGTSSDGATVTLVLPPSDTAAVAMVAPANRTKPYIVMYTSECDLFHEDDLPELLEEVNNTDNNSDNAEPKTEEESFEDVLLKGRDTDVMVSALNDFCDNVVDLGEKQTLAVQKLLRDRVSSVSVSRGNNGDYTSSTLGDGSPTTLFLSGRSVGTSHQTFEIGPDVGVFLRVCPSVDDAIMFEARSTAEHAVTIAFTVSGAHGTASPGVVALAPVDHTNSLVFTLAPSDKKNLFLLYNKKGGAFDGNNMFLPMVDFRWRWVHEEPPSVVEEILRVSPLLRLIRTFDKTIGGVILSIDNDSENWVHTTTNLSASKNVVFDDRAADVVTTSVPPKMSKRLCSVAPRDLSLPWDIKYTCSWTDGLTDKNAPSSLQLEAATEIVGGGLEMHRRAHVQYDHAVVDLSIQNRSSTAKQVLVDLTATSGCTFDEDEGGNPGPLLRHPAFSVGVRMVQIRVPAKSEVLHVAGLQCTSHKLLKMNYDVRWCDVDDMKGHRQLPWPEMSPHQKLF